MTAIKIITRCDVIGEQTQLPGCAATLGDQTLFGQPGFLRPDLCDLIHTALDFLRDFVQKCGAICAARLSIARKGSLGSFHGCVNKVGRADREFPRFAMRRIGPERPLSANPVSSYQMFSDTHYLSLLDKIARRQIAHHVCQTKSPFGAGC